MHPWKLWNFHSHTARDSGRWSPEFTMPSQKRSRFLSRLRPESERLCPQSFRQSAQSDREKAETVFYLTARTITRTVAQDGILQSSAGQRTSAFQSPLRSRPKKNSASATSRTVIRRNVLMRRGIMTGSTMQSMNSGRTEAVI